MYKDNDVKIDQVRMAAEKISRDKNCTIEEVTVKEVKALMGRGSDGYIAAHLQTVKLEEARASRLDDKHLSAQFKAALYDVINLHKANAEEMVRRESSITEQTVKEVCELNNQLTDELSRFKLEMEKRNQELVDRNRELEIELETSHRTIKDHEDVRSHLEAKLGESEKQLQVGLEEIGGLRVRVEQAEKEKGNAFVARDNIQNLLKQTREDLEKYTKSAVSETQRADLLNKENQRLGSEISDLKGDLREVIERAAKAETRLEILMSNTDQTPPPEKRRNSGQAKYPT